MGIRRENRKMMAKLAVITAFMFAFGFALVPIYRAICEATGVNILARGEQEASNLAVGSTNVRTPLNSQADLSRTITVEFDANARGPWAFKPAQSSLQVHPGVLTTVMYEFQNTKTRRMSAQAIPSYAPSQAAGYFHKIACFCFSQWNLEAGEKKEWPVVFVVDPKLPRDVSTITLSYTFFEVGAKTPPAPGGSADAGRNAVLRSEST